MDERGQTRSLHKLNEHANGWKSARAFLTNKKHMTPEAIALLQQNIGKVVRLTCSDGEVIVAKLDLVDPTGEEIVYEMLSTTDESKYEKFDRQPAYLLRFSEISAVSAVTDATS